MATRKPLLDEANDSYNSNNYRDAARNFVLLIGTQPAYKENPVVHLNCGHCFFELKEWKEAIKYLEKASTIFADSGDEHADKTQQSYFLLGMSQFELRKYEAAKKSFQEAQEYSQPKNNISEMITECEQKLNQDTTSEAETTVSSQQPQDSSPGAMLSLPQLAEQYGDVIKSYDRLKEGYELTCLLRDMPTKIEVDSEWYFLPKPWLDKWETFCYSDVITATPGAPNDEIRTVDRTKAPGRIDFDPLFLPKEDNQITDSMTAFTWQNFQVRKGLREGVDFIFVTEEIIKRFIDSYGSVQNNPLKNFKRSGVEQDDGSVILEMQMRRINFFALPNKTTFKMKKTWFCYAAKSDTVLKLERKLLRCINYYMQQVRQERSSLTTKCRLWVTRDSKMTDLAKIDQQYMNYTHSVLASAIPVSLTEEQKTFKIDDLNFVDDDTFLIETPKQQRFVFTHQDGENNEESKEAIANEIAEMAEAAQGLFSMDKLLSTNFSELVPSRGTVKGLCGLQNLGNTCFMNSGLQCLSNTPELTKYFLMGYHLKEANTDNPLGMKGKLAKAFGILIKEMWLGRDNRTAPFDLKRTLGNKISRFSGYGQQDSAELINYLLDLIHEDLNRVKTKPYVEVSEDMNRPEHVIAKEYWDGFAARNASIIVDLMYGQYKSTVTCLTCGRIKHGYDPYLSVCLPIVKEEKLEFSFVKPDSHTKVIDENAEEGQEEQEADYELNSLLTVDVVATRQMMVGDVKQAVLDQLQPAGVTKADLVVCNQKQGKITTMFNDNTKCNDIDQDREYSMVYHVPNQTAETKVIEFNFIKYVKRNKNNYTTELVEKALPRLFALTNDTTIMDVKRLVKDKLRGIFNMEPETDEQLNELVGVHVRDNLPLVPMGKYGARQRATCEFCEQKHGYRDDYCDLELDELDVNQSVENASNATIGQILEKMTHDRRLVLAIVLKSAGNFFNYNELRCRYRRQDGDMTLDSRAQQVIQLKNCFSAFENEEVLTGDDQWYCNICKEHRDITKKMELYNAPKILILQLKRFQQRRGANSGRSGMFGHMYAQIAGQEKNDAFVEFPMDGLDMRPFVRKLANEPEPVYYDLIGVSNHFGSLNGGHYTASCKNIATGEWNYFNDSSVGSCNKSKIVSPAAYILFYRKRDTNN